MQIAVENDASPITRWRK